MQGVLVDPRLSSRLMSAVKESKKGEELVLLHILSC